MARRSDLESRTWEGRPGLAAVLGSEGGRYRMALALFVGVTLLAAAFLISVAFIPPAAAADGMSACLDCHEEEGLDKKLAGGETMNLTVSRAEVEGSVHGRLGCRGCHPKIDLDTHPGDRAIASLGEYRLELSKNCLGCHTAERLRSKPQHAGLVAAGQRFACVECHGAHAVKAVGVAKAALGINDYCLGCHARALTKELAGGGTMSLTIDAGQLKGSVHTNHSCPDCHADFSKEAHPSGAGGGSGERTLHAARACARCHSDKMRQVEGSIHFSLLRSGVEHVPGCSDCHGAHSVGPAARLASLTGMPCRKCHEPVFAAYAGSMHGQARSETGHIKAPLCVNCHQAHEVKGTVASAEHVRQACLGCHTTAAELHAAWLPNSRLHLDAVSCAVCHAPEAKRVIALRFIDGKTGRAFSESEIAGLLGKEFERIRNPKGDGLDGLELWSLLTELQRRQGAGAGVNITGRLEVARGLDAHRLADKAQAVRRCENCHQAGSTFFGQVAVKLAGNDGHAAQYPTAPGILVSVASVLPVSGFYALGSTRIGLLDYLLILAVLGGMAVPAMHITARLITARARKEGEK